MAGAPVNVPDVDGVPALNFVAGAEEGIELLTEDAVGLFGFGQQQWGIYRDGAPVVTADSVVGFTYKQEWALSDYPVEQGAFETYDKVQIPFDCRVRFSAGGSTANRAALLASVAAIAGDLNLYDVATPEQTYESCNVTHYDYQRTSRNGVGLIVVDVWLLQVRVLSGGSTSNGAGASSGSTSGDSSGGTSGGDTQAPSGSDPVNGGTVQPTAPTATQQQTVTSTLAGDGATAAGTNSVQEFNANTIDELAASGYDLNGNPLPKY